MLDKIQELVDNSYEVHAKLRTDHALLEKLAGLVEELVVRFRKSKKLLIAGNGGSAADAQHIAAELSGRFYLDRKPLFAEALHVNTSYLTAVANDYSYTDVYARLLEAKAEEGDVFIGISTSGRSKNIVKAVEFAKSIGVYTVALTGAEPRDLAIADLVINVPSLTTPRIQELHILIGHILCELVEEKIFGEEL